jgi:hypothetical protein
MKQTQYENLGYDDLTAPNATKKVPCMWVSSYDFLTMPGLIHSWDNVCEAYKVKPPSRADDGGLGLGSTGVLTMTNITNTIAGD